MKCGAYGRWRPSKGSAIERWPLSNCKRAVQHHRPRLRLLRPITVDVAMGIATEVVMGAGGIKEIGSIRQNAATSTRFGFCTKSMAGAVMTTSTRWHC